MAEYTITSPLGPSIETGEVTDGAITIAKLDGAVLALIMLGVV